MEDDITDSDMVRTIVAALMLTTHRNIRPSAVTEDVVDAALQDTDCLLQALRKAKPAQKHFHKPRKNPKGNIV